MRSAVEELRTGTEDEGKLYRQAMSKKGLKGGRSDIGTTGRGERGERGRVVKGMESGVPVEYGRGLVESLGKGGWDDGWKR